MKRKSQVKIERPSLASSSVSHGKRVRLWRLFFGSGPRNGTLIVLPLDQGLEHGPTDFFPNPAALDTDFQFRLATEGEYSAIALGIGLAEKYMKEYCGRVPLILKLNGKTNIADDGEAVSARLRGRRGRGPAGRRRRGVHDVRGDPAPGRGDPRIPEGAPGLRAPGDAPRDVGLPAGRAIEAKGGKGTLYAQDYAARVAEEMGADIVKLHEPTPETDHAPEPYRSLREDAPARVRRVVRSAGRVFVLFSGGEKDDRDERVLEKVRLYMDGGATGVMFGRNMWLRGFDDAVALTRKVHAIVARYPG